ncbi:hypothetical protein GZ77_04645 [Endozoicomonas montiporae]|uniref:Autotransporter domain-containing protein n=2 Tax=Endozoicomonas montiporae TaxID=1027273 RepID=A0A081NBJ7_9GAMM|nr:autotransporter outer membrane beta-barrel domain-containing protein [Endozoicomonas montiporae]AMO56106.1 autotransporter [Endozoicomonas montiporae CL-33]KEQ15820.1 hypothetical protein GZ77_04645 [Endozoicomonas montiporae]
MKQVQVFKKTLLSLAVVSALGGYGTYLQADDQPKFNPETFLNGKQADSDEQMKILREISDGLKTDLDKNTANFGIKAIFAEMQKKSVDAVSKLSGLETQLKSAEAAFNEPNGSDNKPKPQNIKDSEKAEVDRLTGEVETAKKEVQTAREGVLNYVKANRDAFGLKDLFAKQDAKNDTGEGGKKPQAGRKELYAEPAEKVDFAAARNPAKATVASVEASSVGIGALAPKAKGEDDAKYQEKVDKALKQLSEIKSDDFKKMFLVKDPAAKDPKAKADTAPQVIRLKGFDLRNPELFDAFMARVQAEVPELFNKTGDPQDVVFTESTVELDKFKTSAAKPMPGVHFATPEKAVATDPYGTYVIADSSDVYQESVGKEKPVDTFIVTEKSSFHSKESVNAAKVQIKDAENVAGFTADADGKVTETYLPLVGKPYENTEVRAETKDGKSGDVIARKRTRAEIQSKKGMVTVSGYQDVEITSSNLKSDGLGVPVTEGGAGTQNMTIRDSEIGMKDGTEIVAENLVIEGKSTIQSVVAAAATSSSDKKDEKAGKQDAKTKETAGLTTIRGANQQKEFEVTTINKDGEKSVTQERIAGVDTFKIGKDAKVMANVEKFEEGTVDGTLISDHIGSKDDRINKLTLGEGAKVLRYSLAGNTIHGSDKLDLTVGKGVTVIHDVDGFHTIVLDGGLLEGNLAGLDAHETASENEKAFEGSSVDLKSGVYQGGNVTNVKSFTISGPVHLAPGSTKLSKMKDDGTGFETTETRSIIITGNVDVRGGAEPVIYKSKDLADDVSPVTVKGNVTFEQGAKLGVALDLADVNEARLSTPYLKIEDGSGAVAPAEVGNGTLTLKGNNRVVLKNDLNQSSEQDVYARLKAIHDKAKEGDVVYDLAVVSYEHREGEFEKPDSDNPLFDVTVKEPKANDGSTTYTISMKYNTDLRSALRSKGLSTNDSEVANAAYQSAMNAPSTQIGTEMLKAISTEGYQRVASENQWDPHVGMGMAAVTVTQKANQSISRHLNRHRTGIATGDMFESQGFWGEYFHSSGEMDDKKDIRGFENKVNGINLGLDAMLNEELTVGFAFTYGDVKTETNKSGRDASGDTFMGTLYTGWTMNNYFFDTMWTYGRGDIDMKRKTSQGTYKSDTKSDTLGARLVGGYNYQYNQWLIQPQVEFNYVKVKFDDFKEKQSQGAFAQSVKLDDFEVMELGAGLKLMADFDVSNGVLKPEFTLMGYHDFKDKKPKVEGTFLNGGGTYRLTGKGREENRVLAGVGVKYEMNNNLTLGLNYDYNWQDDYTAHGIVASVRYDF